MTNYFGVSEYICKCGCGLDKLHPSALLRFNDVRFYYGKPLIVNSGCRCTEHALSLGISISSAHSPQKDGYTYALDFKCDNSTDRLNLIKAGIKAGCTRIGVSSGFMHMDFSPYHSLNVMWTY